MNKWGIPEEVEKAVLERDKKCVYCKCKFSQSIRKRKASWEHIINDIRINGIDNIARCCVGCNASKGNKKLEDWLTSDYCKTNKINYRKVSKVIKQSLDMMKLNPTK
jgi:hypothetical protein